MSEEIVAQTHAESIAAALRGIADRIEKLDFKVAPALSINIQPRDDVEADEVELVDAVGMALFDKVGEPREMSNGSWHHDVSGHFAPVNVSAFTGVTSPAERERLAEVERLRARVAELETAELKGEVHSLLGSLAARVKTDEAGGR